MNNQELKQKIMEMADGFMGTVAMQPAEYDEIYSLADRLIAEYRKGELIDMLDTVQTDDQAAEVITLHMQQAQAAILRERAYRYVSLKDIMYLHEGLKSLQASAQAPVWLVLPGGERVLSDVIPSQYNMYHQNMPYEPEKIDGVVTIKEARNAKGITQQQLSEMSGVKISTLQKLESGAISVPKARFETVRNLARVLDVPMEILG